MKLLLLGLLGASLLSCNGSGGGSNNPAPTTQNQPIQTDVSTLSKIEQGFHCIVGENTNINIFADGNGGIEAHTQDGRFPGTYQINQNSIVLSIPAYNFQDTLTQHEVFKGILITSVGSAIKCKGISHTVGSKLDASLKCPTIKYVPNTKYEKNFFHYTTDGMVKRVQQVEIPNDTLTYTEYGVYFIEGNLMTMLFGGATEERRLNGSITNNQLLINELEPDKGACVSY